MPAPGHEIGRNNLEAVRGFFATHLCATQVECARALGLSVMAINRHVRTIRSEWRDDTWEAARGIAPNVTGELSSEAFVRNLRDDWDR